MAPVRETRERERSRREKESEYWFGMSKIVFTAMVVGSVMTLVQGEKADWALIVVVAVGFVLTFGLYAIGHYILTKTQKTWKVF